MAMVYLGLGSNMGAREGNIRRAVDELRRHGMVFDRMAAIIETDAVGGPAQGKYLNTVIRGETALSPEDLLKLTQAVEIRLGRVRFERNGPRLIDIDILLYDDLTLKTRTLTVPHPRMMERSFVLEPLREIDPDLVDRLTRVRREELILQVIAM